MVTIFPGLGAFQIAARQAKKALDLRHAEGHIAFRTD